MSRTNILLVVVIISALCISTSYGATVNIYPGDGIPGAQAKIETANPGDEVIFNSGSYSVPQFVYISLKPGIEGSHIRYHFEGADVYGTGVEHDGLIGIVRGGYIDLTASDSTFRDSKQVISIGDQMLQFLFKEISLAGLNVNNIHRQTVAFLNIPHQSPLEEAPVQMSSCIIDGGSKAVAYNEVAGTTENSPWVGVENCTVANLSGPWAIDVPSFRVADGNGGFVTVMLGNDDLNNNVFIDCEAFSDPEQYVSYNSPTQNCYKDVNEPYIGDPNDDNRMVDANDFYQDTLQPTILGRMNFGKGSFAGAYQFVASQGTIKRLSEVWCSQEGEPEYDPKLDLNGDNKINFLDFAVIAGPEVWKGEY